MATRAQVDEARSKGGKPRDANRIAGRTAAMDVYDDENSTGSAKASDGSTVERGPNGEIYRYVPKYDYTTVERDGNVSAPMKGNQLPGGMNKYIDKMLDMSGMNDGASSGADVPVPTARPNDSGMSGTDNNPGKLADDTIAPAAAPEDHIANSDASTFGEAVAGLLGAGGLAGAAAYAYNKLKPKGAIDSTIDAIDGDADTETRADMRSEQPAIAQEERAALPPPQQKLAAPSAVDETIDAIDGPPPQITDADAPYTPRNPAPAAVDLGVAASTAPKSRAEIFQSIAGMKPRDALAVLQQNGMTLSDLGPEEIRALAAASNATKAGRQAAATAVESAVRGAAR